SGPGVFNCAWALAGYMAQKIPVQIFQVGIAGVFRESGLGPGDVAVADEIQYLHTGVRRPGKLPGPLPFALISDHPDTCFGRYSCDERLATTCLRTLQKKRQDLTNERFQVVQGKILTVSQITGEIAQKMDIPGKKPPVMEAMEGAAAAHGAALYGIPLVEIRAGSNMTGDRDKSRWNIPLAAGRISWVLDCLMDMDHIWE
ncbi:MAG: futalosine hydrolase, partial [Acidobacteria bacterium]